MKKRKTGNVAEKNLKKDEVLGEFMGRKEI